MLSGSDLPCLADVAFRLESVGVPAERPSPARAKGRVEFRASGRPMRDWNFAGRRWADPGNVVTCPVARGKSGHPARMPDALAEFFIKLATKEGDVVLDPFLGSGTTARVAERLNRRWLGFEIHRDYVDLG